MGYSWLPILMNRSKVGGFQFPVIEESQQVDVAPLQAEFFSHVLTVSSNRIQGKAQGVGDVFRGTPCLNKLAYFHLHRGQRQ